MFIITRVYCISCRARGKGHSANLTPLGLALLNGASDQNLSLQRPPQSWGRSINLAGSQPKILHHFVVQGVSKRLLSKKWLILRALFIMSRARFFRWKLSKSTYDQLHHSETVSLTNFFHFKDPPKMPPKRRYVKCKCLSDSLLPSCGAGLKCFYRPFTEKIEL